MKASLLYIALMFTLLNCTSNERVSPSDPESAVLNVEESRSIISQHSNQIDIPKVEKVMTLSVGSRKVAYLNMLSEYEKYYFWIKKINTFASANNLSLEEKGVLKELLINLKPNYFADPIAAKNFSDSFLEKWSLKSEKIFGKDVLSSLVGTVSEAQVNYRVITSDGGVTTNGGVIPSKPSCDCGGSDGRLGRCGQNKKCGSTGSGCTTSSFGCGDLLLQTCSGQCING